MNPYQIIRLRRHAPRSETRDRAIVDLLELRERHLIPGRVTTAKLRILWGCSASMISRRLAAINDLPGWRVTWQLGPRSYARIEPRPVTDSPKPANPLSARQRWERVREALRGGVDL
jgi:hypothetical protein